MRVFRIVPYSTSLIRVEDRACSVDAFAAALRDAGYAANLSGLSRSSESRPLTSTHEAFEIFAQLAVAPTVLAILDLFADRSELGDRDDFAVSCLPNNNRTRKDGIRVTAVSVGWVKVLAVIVDKSASTVSEVGMWCESDANVDGLAAWPSVEVHDSELDGGGLSIVCPGQDALEFIAQPSVGSLLAGRVAGIRRRRRRVRRSDWHNQWLWELVASGIASPSRQGAFEEIVDVSSPDVVRSVRQRTSHAQFRALLLKTQPKECAICGIDVVDVLEAAHLMPHAKGGAASTENGRLLCANHHRAYDAGLYNWTGREFVWMRVDAEPHLGGCQQRPTQVSGTTVTPEGVCL